MSFSDLKLFALSSNQELAERVAQEIGIELGKSSVRQFSDGEIQVNIEESIRGKHVFILQSTSSPVNDNLLEILIMVDALKRASAESVNVVMPYYGYARQDRKARAREPITSKLVANMLEVAGVDRLLTIDLHAAQIQGFFDIPVDHLMGAPLIADYFERRGMVGSDYVVVSPDHGGVTRARKLAEFLKTSIAIIDKRRSVDKMNTSEVMNIIGKVEGKTCILIDDMIDTAGTICHAADALAEAGAVEVYASCTHPVLSGPAMDNIQKSVKQIASNKQGVLQAEKAYSIMQKSFEIGSATFIQVNDADLALTSSRLSYNQAIFDYLTAKSDLELLLYDTPYSKC